jgi:hypothetical protein
MPELSSAAGHARWLADVAQALDDAETLVERMSGTFAGRRERAELLYRIEAARQATRALRLRSDRRIGAASSSRMNQIPSKPPGWGPAG